MSPPPRYFFLSSVADQIVKTNRPGHQRMNRGLSMEWEVRELLDRDSSSSLFRLFSGYHARNLAILSHLNVIFFSHYSKIAAVFLTVPPQSNGGYAHVRFTASVARAHEISRFFTCEFSSLKKTRSKRII